MTCFQYGLPLHGGCAHKSPLSRNTGTAWKRPRRATSPAYATMQTSTVSGMSDKPARQWGGQSAPRFVHAISQAQMHALGYFAHLFISQTLQPTSGLHVESENPKLRWYSDVATRMSQTALCRRQCGEYSHYQPLTCTHKWRHTNCVLFKPL